MAANKSILIDSNIAIYSALPEFDRLREWLFHKRIFVSQITRLEVLGYHSLTVDDKSYFEKFFEECRIVPIGEDEISKAIELRQIKSMSLGDSIIAASALHLSIILLTANTIDFKHIRNLELIDSSEI